jgi:hypothetical protein
MEAAAMAVAVEVAAMVVAVEAADMAETVATEADVEAVAMEVDVEAVAAMVVDSPTTRAVMAAVAAATEVDREGMEEVATKLFQTCSQAMYSTNAEHQVFSVFCHFYQDFHI